MNEVPFFSILIPTKNRSHLVGYAIRSVLQQDFEDFEVIVCDNDDDEVATRKVVEQFLDDTRVTYIRTGGLDMVANWNRALNASTGRYVSVLEDKMIFYPGALFNICEKINKSSSGVVVWGTDVINNSNQQTTLRLHHESKDRILTSDQVLDMICVDIRKYKGSLPRGLCSVVPKSLIDRITKQDKANFYEPIAPDFVSAFKILANIDHWLLTGNVFTLTTCHNVSNGINLMLRKDGQQKYFMGKNNFQLDCEFVPVKSNWIVVNLLVNDYRKISAKYGGKLSSHVITHKNYVKMMWMDLLMGVVQLKKISWTSKECFQLLSSEKKYFVNALYLMQLALSLSVKFIGKLMKPKQTDQAISIYPLEKDGLDRVESFLSGKEGLGWRQPF